MNTVLTFLQENAQRLELERLGLSGGMSCVMITPRFRASSHVVFLVLAQGQPDPVLVAKVPRLTGVSASNSVKREVSNLRAIQMARPEGFDSIPRVVAFEDYAGRPILVETALVGEPMDRAMIRRDLARCCQSVTRWLIDVQRPGVAANTDGGFRRLVERPLNHFAAAFPLLAEEAQLLKQTWELVAPLNDPALPLVFEHGDLCHPNLFRLKSGELGVVDWELAEPHGLPAYDLFFFLTYAAFAQNSAADNRKCEAAFHKAFFGRSAWARPYVRDYAEQMGLKPHLLTPLFVLTWVRYLSSLLTRLNENDRGGTLGVENLATWVRANRYYTLWRHAVDHAGELNWNEA
ncbi:MAG: phosphotransferase family protein [Anaerolineales bacterium]